VSEANETRGEISLELDGTEYVLRPSYQAIQAIEKKTGKGLIALARDAAGADLTLSETAIVASECIRAHGRAVDDKMMAAVSPERIGELILEADDGVAMALGRISVLLGLAATGGYTAQGELKPTKLTGTQAKA